MNETTWHESAIWFFIAQKLLFANQYVRKFHKIKKTKNLKDATFNNISVISWQSVLLVQETRVHGENHRPAASH